MVDEAVLPVRDRRERAGSSACRGGWILGNTIDGTQAA
jgi:hypothetical protein